MGILEKKTDEARKSSIKVEVLKSDEKGSSQNQGRYFVLAVLNGPCC
jgi:hypothetical protein